MKLKGEEQIMRLKSASIEPAEENEMSGTDKFDAALK